MSEPPDPAPEPAEPVVCDAPGAIPAATDVAVDGATSVEPSPGATVPSAWYDLETSREVLRRVKRTAVAAAVGFAIFCWFYGGFRAVLGLTCSAAVTIISFLWLEEVAGVLLEPAAHLHARRLTLRSLARFVLLGVTLTVTIIVARFNALSVLLGFSVIVVGICGEALYSLFRSFAGER